MTLNRSLHWRQRLSSGERISSLWVAGRIVSSGWLGELLKRRNANVAAVALTSKNVRIAWALLAHDREFKPDYTASAA
jgi:transposase